MTEMPFTPEEYACRLGTIRAEMSNRSLDALILTRPPNIYYSVGYSAANANWTSPLLALIIPADGDLQLVTREIERVTAAAQIAPVVRTYRDHESAHAVVAGILSECGAASGRVGVEEHFLSASNLRQLERAAPRVNLQDASWLVETIRTSLSPEEVTCVRKAGDVTNIGFSRALDLIKPGVLARDVIADAHAAMYHGGQSDVEISRLWIWFGPNGGRLHDTDVTRPFKDSEYATVEIWGNHRQYLAASQGTIYLGDSPPKVVAETHQLLAEMYCVARDAARPGALTGEVFDAANAVYRARRGADYWRRIGTNMGLSFGPMDLGVGGEDVIRPWTPLILQLVEIDPGLITCCGTLLVTDEGIEELVSPLLDLTPVV
jgi:Xaa-Pro aminopeptidase